MAKIKAKNQRQAGALILACSFLVGFGIGALVFNASTNQGSILFTIAYSSEKEGWMAEIKPLFDEWCTARFPGLQVKANFFPVGSRESIIAIINRQYTPAIWSPAAATWIPVLNHYWAEQPAFRGQAITTENVSAVYSPIVMAMWESIATAYNITSIQDVHDLTLVQPSPIKLAHTDPRLSNSGFCTVIMEVAVAAGKNSSDLVFADLSNSSIKAWVKQFESIAVQYGKSTGYLLEAMLQAGPTGITTAFLYENLIIESAAEAKSQWGDIIKAIYPAEGSIHSDHPFCVLDKAPWMTPTLLDISRAFMHEFLEDARVLELATHHGFRPYNQTIPLPDSIFNNNNGVQNNISTFPKMAVPVDGDFTARVSDFWLINRPVF